MRVVIDFETKSACELKKAGAWRYSEDDTTDFICLGYSISGGDPAICLPGDPCPRVFLEPAETITFVAHNAAFERAIWRNIMVPRYGWPDITTPEYKWLDTMACAARKALPQSLEEVGRVLRLNTQKDKAGSEALRKIMKPHKGVWNNDPALYETVYKYCKTDVEVEDSLLNRLGGLPKSEYAAWQHNEIMNERGLPLDMMLVASMQKIVDAARIPALAEFQKLTGVEKAGSPKFLEWCRDHTNELCFPDMQAETVKEALKRELPEDVRAALLLRKTLTSASVKKLAAMRACVCSDGRVRGGSNYHGAATGRNAGRLIQPTNFPRGAVEFGKDDDGNVVSKPEVLIPIIQSENWELLEMVSGNAVEAVAASLRNVIRATPGYKIVVRDYSTIEVRVLLALAGQYDKLEVMRDPSKDVYCDFASKVFSRSIDKKLDAKIRQETGKPGVLGCGYGMGKDKFAAKEHIQLDAAEKIVQTYRKEWAPQVPRLWRSLENAAAKAMWDKTPQEFAGVEYRSEGEWLTARLPSGRKLFYYGPECVRRKMPWDETDIRMGWTYKAKKLGKWTTVDAYGGHLTENCVQALSRDIMVPASLKAEQEGYRPILTVYDEIICEAPEHLTDDGLGEIMADIPQWARDLRIPIATEGFSAERYRK